MTTHGKIYREIIQAHSYGRVRDIVLPMLNTTCSTTRDACVPQVVNDVDISLRGYLLRSVRWTLRRELREGPTYGE